MNGVQFPDHWRIELLKRSHNRKSFQSGHTEADRWLSQSALQSQLKHLTSTKVLLDKVGSIVGYYTLATSQVDFSDLPVAVAKSNAAILIVQTAR